MAAAVRNSKVVGGLATEKIDLFFLNITASASSVMASDAPFKTFWGMPYKSIGGKSYSVNDTELEVTDVFYGVPVVARKHERQARKAFPLITRTSRHDRMMCYVSDEIVQDIMPIAVRLGMYGGRYIKYLGYLVYAPDESVVLMTCNSDGSGISFDEFYHAYSVIQNYNRHVFVPEGFVRNPCYSDGERCYTEHNLRYSLIFNARENIARIELRNKCRPPMSFAEIANPCAKMKEPTNFIDEVRAPPNSPVMYPADAVQALLCGPDSQLVLSTDCAPPNSPVMYPADAVQALLCGPDSQLVLDTDRAPDQLARVSDLVSALPVRAPCADPIERVRRMMSATQITAECFQQQENEIEAIVNAGLRKAAKRKK